MARKEIGTLWDRDMRNAIDDNFKELYSGYIDVGLSADEAKAKALDALNKSTQALLDTGNMQSQLDTIVIDGDSSVEAAQARVDKSGNIYTTLKQRLDAENEAVTSKLAEIMQMSDNKKIKLVACILRNDGAGWYFVGDDGTIEHDHIGVSSVETLSDRIRVHFNFNAKNILGFVATPDDTFQSHGFFVGSSVGTDYADIKISKVEPSCTAYITKSSSKFTLDENNSNNIKSISYDNTLKKLTIKHNTTSSKNININDRAGKYEAVLTSPVSDDSYSITFRRKLPISGYIYYDGSKFVIQNSKGLQSAVWDSGQSALVINHDDCGLSYALSAIPKDSAYQISVKSVTSNTMTIKFYRADGAAIGTPDDNMKLFISRNPDINAAVIPDDDEIQLFTGRASTFINNINPSTISTAFIYDSSNIWCIGVFEVD